MKFNLIIWLFVSIQKNFILSESNNFICPINKPLLVINSENNECVINPYNPNNYKISNEIIKIQWLNKMNNLGINDAWYMAFDFSTKGDLIIESLIFRNAFVFKERYYYGIKSNGRPLFYIKENDKFTNQITLKSNSDIVKFESIMIKIKLTNNDDKDYYLSSCFDNNTIDIFDFYNHKVYGIFQQKLFDYSIWSTKYYNILELKNEDKTYMFCFIGQKDNHYYLSLQKLKFNNANITKENSYKKIASSLISQEFSIYNSLTLTCFEISKYNIIQCFYLNINGNYTVGLFKEDTLDFIYSEIIDEAPQGILVNNSIEIFYRSINLKNEISVFAYMLNVEPESIFIQIKNLVYNKYGLKYELEDYLIKYKRIEMKKEGEYIFNSYYYLSDLKRINPNKFVLISSDKYDSEIAYNLYIIIFDIYNFHETNLFIRYYYIQLILYNYKIYRYLLSIPYNGFIGLIYSIKIGGNGDVYQKFSIFSYINSTDSELITIIKKIIHSLY